MDSLLKEINKISLRFLSSLTLEETYKMVIDEATKFTNTKYGAIYINDLNFFNLAYSSLGGIKAKHPKESFISKAHKGKKAFQIKKSLLANPHPVFDKNGIKSLIYIPLTYKKESIGVLILFSKEKFKLDVRRLEILGLFGSMATLTIIKSRSDKEKEEAIFVKKQSLTIENILEKINISALKFLEQTSVEKTYKIIIDEAKNLSKAEYGSILLCLNGVMKKVYSSDVNIAKIKVRKGGFTYLAFKTASAFVVEASKFDKVHPEIRRMGIKSTIFIPLSNNNKTIGVLSLDSLKEESFSERELKMLMLFGSMASLAIKKAQLYKETQQALELRDKFIAIAAHEFRTPLTSINGYVQLLFQKLSNKNTTESRWIEQLNFETKRLIALVSELLEINRIKAGKLNYLLKECSIRDIVKRASETFSFSSSANVLIKDSLNFHDKIIGDPEKLEQVIINLLDNAVKFSQKDRVIVTLAQTAKFLIISVKDFGPGIPKEEIPRILQGFYKNENSDQSGMGLGFYLINNIIKLHRGSLEIYSKINKGTTVEIKLPKVNV